MGGEQAGGIGLGVFACLLGLGGIVAALRTRRRRARFAATYGSTGGMVYTVVQIGCSGLLLLGGVGLMVLALVFRR